MKTFKEFISEASVKIRRKRITVTKPDRAAGDVLVNVNTKEFDRAWANDHDFYIGKGGKGGIKGRYEKFGNFVLGGEMDIGDGIKIPMDPAESIESSEVYVTGDGRIQFTNGRHRFAWLRDHGAKKIPVAMNKESYENAKRHALV